MKKNVSKQKIEDLKVINGFSKISVRSACRFYNINQSNLKKGNVNEELIHKVRRYLECEFAKLFVYEGDTDE